MSERTERFKKRQAKRAVRKESSHIKDLGPSDTVQELLSEKVDHDLTDNVLLQSEIKYTSEVNSTEVSDFLDLLDNGFSREKYDVLFSSSKDVLLDQLLKPFNLSRSDLSNSDRDFTYHREDYVKSPKASGGEGDSFATVRDNTKQAKTNSDGNITDTYTGVDHSAADMDLDHIKSLKDFHDDGGFMLDPGEKSSFAADSDNHTFTHKSINRSKGSENLKDYADSNVDTDKRRTNAADAKAQKASEKYVPSSSLEKTAFVVNRAASDGVNAGAKQGAQQALGVLTSEFISAIYHEVHDIFANGWGNSQDSISWIASLKSRIINIKDKLLTKWKSVITAFKDGAIAGFLSAIITAVINMFVRTGQNIVRIIREGFLSLVKALKVLISPPEGMTTAQAAHEASKVLATGLTVTGGIMVGELIAQSLTGLPFAGIISTIITGMISGLGSLFVVFMLDKMDLFGVNADERHKFIMGELNAKIDDDMEQAEEIINRLGLA